VHLQRHAIPLIVLLWLGCVASTLAAPPGEAARANYEAGLQAKRAGDSSAAQSHLIAAVTECPTYADAYWVLGWVQADLGHAEAACVSFNRFLGVAPADERCAQARAAIERLGGTVTPIIPDGGAADPAETAQAVQATETAPPNEQGEAPAQEAEAAAAAPQVSREEALALLTEAEQALSQSDYATAIAKATQTLGVLPEEGRLHLTLALAYGGIAQWGPAFEHAQKLTEINDSNDNRCYIVLTALAPDYPVLAQGFADEKRMNALIMAGDMAAEESVGWIGERMNEATGGDVSRQCMYFIGEAIFDFTLFFGYQEQNVQMMQIAHMNLMMALEDPKCPPELQPETNEWISRLTSVDFLWPQSGVEWEAYRSQTDWNDMILTGRADSRQVNQWRDQLMDPYQSDLDKLIEFSTGLALASHDTAWRVSGPSAGEVSILQLQTAAQVMRNVVQEFPGRPRAQRLADFFSKLAPEQPRPEPRPAVQQPQPQTPMDPLQPQTQIEQYGFSIGMQLRQAQLGGRISAESFTARIQTEMQRYQTLETLSQFLIGDSLAAYHFFRQMGSQEGVELAVQSAWQVLKSAPPGSAESMRANQVVNAMMGH
jgi:tetratricopeptide (TPR) repeat protein